MQLISQSHLRSLIFLTAACGAGLTPLSGQAVPFVVNEDIVGVWNNLIVVGAAVRAKDPDKQLVGFNNAPEYAGAKGAVGVADDGNLNYHKGDVISSPITYITDLELNYQGKYGVYGKVRSWYDYVGEERNVPHGSISNGFEPNQPLNDSDYDSFNQFSGYEVLDMYVYGNWDIGEDRLTARLGQQSINWGESLLHLGINAFNPVDFATLGRPGLRQDDALVPVERIYANWITRNGISLEAFYALGWEPSHMPACGTLSQAIDSLIGPGCYAATAGAAATDQEQFNLDVLGLGSPQITPRYRLEYPDSDGQFGLSSRYFVEQLGTEFGLYYINYNSVNPVLNVDLCTPNLISALIGCSSLSGYALPLEYVEDIQAYGLSAVTGFENITLSTEVSLFHDLPAQRNFPELIEGSVFDKGIYYDRMQEAGAGAMFPGYTLIDRTQWLLSGTIDLGNQGRLTDTTLAIESALQWNDLPSTDEERIGRNPNWGAAADPTTGFCNIPATKPGYGTPNVECSDDGFATDFSWGYRMLATTNYSLSGLGVDLTPSALWIHDVEGYSADGAQVEGRMGVNMSVRAVYQRAFFVSVGRTFWNEDTDYDVLRDKDIWSFTAGMAF